MRRRKHKKSEYADKDEAIRYMTIKHEKAGKIENMKGHYDRK